jgi:anti-sigma regulatory factor (Ser/Thr protein kinase)
VAEPRNDPEIHVELLSRPELLAPLRAMVNAMAQQVGLDDIGACHLVLAMDEALTNIIRHGYDGSPDGRIWLTLSHLSDGPGLRVEISDRARTVDPTELQGRDLEDVRPGGLGMHLIRTLVDRFEHAPRAGGGMRIVLEKRPAVAIAGVA